MPGGLVQLLAWGTQNIKLNGNPSITFFKKVRKAHSNFSMESIRINLNRTDVNLYNTTVFRGKIGRHGDLVQQIYFVFELPDISVNDLGFRWIRDIGEAAIDTTYVTVGGTLVDRQYGEFMHITNMLQMGQDKKAVYDKLIGNVNELRSPDLDYVYPTQDPAIASRKVYVPLNFWFNKESSSSLPLVCLQYSDTEIVIEMRPFTQLYQVNGFAPNPLNEYEQLSSLVYNGLTQWLKSPTVLDIKAYLEVNYYFVDTMEREQIVYNPHEYLIEQTTRIERFTLSTNTVFEMILQNPVKEFIWVLKRTNINLTNEWFDFLDYSGKHIMKSAKFIFNGMDRIDEKDAFYFNYIQPLQHHMTNMKDGVYVYSFSIDPDDRSQPSGSCNMSRIQRIQMMLNIIEPLTSIYDFNLTVYAVSYNFLKISSGLAGVVFSS